MDRLDRLILKAKPKRTLKDRLEAHNPYLNQGYNELEDYLDAENYRAPEQGTWAWSQYIYALMLAYSDRSRGELEVMRDE